MTIARSTDPDEATQRAAELAQAEGQRIQARVERKDKARSAATVAPSRKPMQAGTRDYPAEFPAQHLRKHGSEAELELAPMFEAPGYKGSEKLKDMVAIITGGSSGIGRAIATLYAREGADVAIVHLSNNGDAETTKAVVEREGRRCLVLRGDVSDSVFCRAAVEQTMGAFGRLDILVNNAAFQQHAEDILDLSDEHFDRTMKTNLYGYFYMARAAIPHMKPRSSILMTGSLTGIMGNKDLLDYSMTKGGIHAFTKSLAAHLIDRGIRVNAVAPGPVWTALNPADRPADKIKHFGADTLMRRAAQPEEIAPAFVFLAAPSCSSYITGEVLPVIGGYVS